MTVTIEPEYQGLHVPTQGIFLGTYESDNAQASAKLFQRGEFLRALLSYPKGNEPGRITDEYLDDLRRLAEERGLKLKLLHVG